MSQTQNAAPTFHVGITMAGAGSAGCYTGGAMDYLFQILDMWEKASQKNLPGYEEFYDRIPKPNVVIDVMGGTSAGGMTTCMSAIYALNGRVNHVKEDPNLIGGKRDNIFYDSWVLLDDDIDSKGKKTLSKAWDTDDLLDNKFVSLLNTKIIDDIADNALGVKDLIERIIRAQPAGDAEGTDTIRIKVKELPSYISKDLDVLQVHTMLRGIPLAIEFVTPIGKGNALNKPPEHNTFEHFMVSHYKLNNGEKPDTDKFLWLNPYGQKFLNIMALTTKATGAFPVGLKFREIDNETFSDEYLKCVTKRTIFNRFGQAGDEGLDFKNFPTNFSFLTIDGGAINNEPFGEVLGILKSRYNDCFDEDGHAKYGVVMIDPFPDEVDGKEKYTAPDDLFGVIPAIINTLHDQSKVKRDDILEAARHPYFRGEIYPSRWIDHDKRIKDENPITTAGATAFAGFLDIRFRHYDFYLGRDNARNYFRYFFSFEYDPANNIIHPIHRSWPKEMADAFLIKGHDGKTYLPIIPDLDILLEKKAGSERSPFDYSIKQKPKYNPEELFAMRIQMEDRFEKILDIAKLKLVQTDKEIKDSLTGRWIDKFHHKSWWDRLKGRLINGAFNFIFSVTKGGLARNITEMAIKWVLTDLEKKELLEDVSKEETH